MVRIMNQMPPTSVAEKIPPTEEVPPMVRIMNQMPPTSVAKKIPPTEEVPPKVRIMKQMAPTYVAKKILPTEEVLRDIFKKYDANGDGHLSKAELTEAFRYLGSRNPGWRASRGIHHADVNGDGFISEEELSGLVKYARKHGYAV